MQPFPKSCTCISPINVALVKYWGKRDSDLNLPLNSSFSVTLDCDQIFTKTRIDLLPTRKKKNSLLILNGENKKLNQHSKVNKFISCAKRMGLSCQVRIETCNNFPDSAGLASSSSAFSSMSICLGRLIHLDSLNVGRLARVGSGSSCRSLYGGFVEWEAGSLPDGSDSLPVQIYPHTIWPELRCLTVQVSSNRKSISSTVGMQSSVHSSDLLLLKTQATLSQKRIESIKNAISEKDFHSFAVTVMKESNTFHAICQDTFPPIQPPYMTEKSHKIVQFVHSLNSFLGHTVACYTFDAGPNAFIFVLEKDIKVFLTFFLTIFPKPLNDVPHISKLIERYDIKLPCKNHINLQMKPDSTFLFETLYLCKVGAGPVIVE